MIRSLLSLGLGLALVAGLVGVSPVAADFNPERFSAADAKKFYKRSGTRQSAPPARIAITEFTVEYVTQQRSATGKGVGGLTRFAVAAAKSATGVGKTSFEIDPAAMAAVPDQLYAELTEALSQRGYEVVPRDDIAGCDAYTRLKTEAAGRSGRSKVKGGLGQGSVSRTANAFPASGLDVFDEGAFSQASNARSQARILRDLGADLALRVRLFVSIEKKKPVIEQRSMVHIVRGFNQTRMPGGKEIINPKRTGQLNQKKKMILAQPVVGDKTFKLGSGSSTAVDSGLLASQLRDAYTAVAQMVAASI